MEHKGGVDTSTGLAFRKGQFDPNADLKNTLGKKSL